MTIPIGRRRFVFMVTDASPSAVEANPIPGADDRELFSFSRANRVDPEVARWAGLGLMYGGHLRSSLLGR